MNLIEATLNPTAFRNGDVLLVETTFSWLKPMTWISRQIQRTTYPSGFRGFRANHSGILYWNEADHRWHIVEALWHVTDARLSSYATEGAYKLRVCRPATAPVPMDAAITFAREQVGEDYSLWTLAKIRAYQMVIGYSTLGGYGAIPAAQAAANKEVLDASHWICSRLVLHAYCMAGVDLGLGEFATPGDLDRTLTQTVATFQP